jgi:opacity protein-like surface antigen
LALASNFLPNWSAKIEYDAYDFKTKTFSIPISIFPFVANATGIASSTLTVQTIKFGVNYRFNPGWF